MGDLAERIANQLHYPFNNKELLEAFANLVFQMRDHLGQYDTLLSDDVSGRLPALVLWELNNRIRRERGQREAEMFGIAAGRDAETRETNILHFLHKKRDRLGRILIVTEFISSGRSIERLVKLLLDCGIDNFDIATVSVVTNSKTLFGLGKHCFWGSKGDIAVRLLYNNSCAGIEKHGRNVHPRRDSSLATRKDIVTARKDASLLAKWLHDLRHT